MSHYDTGGDGSRAWLGCLIVLCSAALTVGLLAWLVAEVVR